MNKTNMTNLTIISVLKLCFTTWFKNVFVELNW